MGVYPFMFGTAKDFEPVVEEMVRVGYRSGARPRLHGKLTEA